MSKSFWPFSIRIHISINGNFIYTFRLVKLPFIFFHLCIFCAFIKPFAKTLRLQQLSIFNRIRFMNFPYLMIKLRLSKFWFINLIMPILPITNQINQNIFFKFLSIFNTQFDSFYNIFNILGVNMNNWNIKSFCYI